MATALNVGHTGGNVVNPKTGHAKSQEKRGTNPSSPDADERIPKRRLLRNSAEDTKLSSSWQKATSQITQRVKNEKTKLLNSSFTIDIQTKSNNDEAEGNLDEESTMKLNLEENVILIKPEEKLSRNLNEVGNKQNDGPTYGTPKEKQCWAMYCKMTEKGINVSYDTILRGMLTPTEYRIRRKTSIAEEINMLLNPPSEDLKTPSPECPLNAQIN